MAGDGRRREVQVRARARDDREHGQVQAQRRARHESACRHGRRRHVVLRDSVDGGTASRPGDRQKTARRRDPQLVLRLDGRGQEGRLPRGRRGGLRQEAFAPPDARDVPLVLAGAERPRQPPSRKVVRRRHSRLGHRDAAGGRARPRVLRVLADARRPEERHSPVRSGRLHGRHGAEPRPDGAVRPAAKRPRTRHGHLGHDEGRRPVVVREDRAFGIGARGLLQVVGRTGPHGTGDEAGASGRAGFCRRGVPGRNGEPALVHPLLDDRQGRQDGDRRARHQGRTGNPERTCDDAPADEARRDAEGGKGRARSGQGGDGGRGRRDKGRVDARRERRQEARRHGRRDPGAADGRRRTLHPDAPRHRQRPEGGEVVEGRRRDGNVDGRRGVGVQRIRVRVHRERGRGGHQPRGIRADRRRDRPHQREDRTALRARAGIVAFARADQVPHLRGDGTGDALRRRGGLPQVAREPHQLRREGGRQGRRLRGRRRRAASADGDRTRQGVRQALPGAAEERTGHAGERGQGALGQLRRDASAGLRNVHRHGGRHAAVVRRLRRDDHRQHDAAPAHPQRHDAPREPPRRR